MLSPRLLGVKALFPLSRGPAGHLFRVGLLAGHFGRVCPQEGGVVGSDFFRPRGTNALLLHAMGGGGHSPAVSTTFGPVRVLDTRGEEAKYGEDKRKKTGGGKEEKGKDAEL